MGAFTLIELLVVIAIIALLAAILFPSFARARENSRRGACQSHLKQIGLGILQYAQDYDEVLPPDVYPAAAVPRYGWQWLIQPYVKSEQVFLCPSAVQSGYGSPKTFSPSGFRSCYFLNQVYCFDSTKGGLFGAYTTGVCDVASGPPSSLADVADSSGTVMASDGADTDVAAGRPGRVVGSGALTYLPTTSPPLLGSNEGDVAFFHLETSNTLFMDGHVKTQRVASLNRRTGFPANSGDWVFFTKTKD